MIPNFIKIGGLVYKINQIVMGDEGEATHSRCVININADLNESKKLMVLFHEIFEIINEEHQLNLKHRKIMTLAFDWHQVIIDNKEMFR
jgi:hypothetical protein